MKSSQNLTMVLGAFVFGSCVMPAEDAAQWPDVVETISPGRLHRVMEYGVELEAYSEEGLTALEVAVWNGRPLEIVQDLLDAGADLDVRGINEAGLVQGAVEGYRRNAAAPVRLLLEAGCKIHTQDSYGNTAWWMALKAGDVLALRVLDGWDESTTTPHRILNTYLSGRSIKMESVFYLLDEMKRTNPTGWEQDVPLDSLIPDGGQFWTMSDGGVWFFPTPTLDPVIFSHLIAIGFPINRVDAQGNNLLHYACKKRDSHVALVSFLLQLGADPNLANGDGQHPLHLLVQREFFGWHWQGDFDALLADGAHFNALNALGQTPLILANELSDLNPYALSFLQTFEAREEVKE